MTNQEVLTNYVKQITSALKNVGVDEVVISPGSRSTPLAYAFSASKAFKIYMQVDERSAGFLHLDLQKHPENQSFYFVHQEQRRQIIIPQLRKHIMQEFHLLPSLRIVRMN